MQDLILYTRDGAPLAKLLVEAAARFRAAGVEAFGVSAWDPAHWEVLEGVGLRPYARSVLLVWDTASGLPKSPNEKVRVEPRDPSMGTKILRRIQRSSWGFFIPPESSVQFPRPTRPLLLSGHGGAAQAGSAQRSVQKRATSLSLPPLSSLDCDVAQRK